MFILKSKINATVQKARDNERKIQEKDWKGRLDRALAEQREVYELVIQEKALEVETLNGIIEQQKARMNEANEKEMQSKRIFLKAKEILSCVDFEYKRSLENHARSMGQMDKIRHDAETFTKQLLGK